MNTLFQKTVELRHIHHLVFQRRRLEQYWTQFPNFLKFFNQNYNQTSRGTVSHLCTTIVKSFFFLTPIFFLSMFLSQFSLLFPCFVEPQHIPQTSQWHPWVMVYLISKLKTKHIFNFLTIITISWNYPLNFSCHEFNYNERKETKEKLGYSSNYPDPTLKTKGSAKEKI